MAFAFGDGAGSGFYESEEEDGLLDRFYAVDLDDGDLEFFPEESVVDCALLFIVLGEDLAFFAHDLVYEFVDLVLHEAG